MAGFDKKNLTKTQRVCLLLKDARKEKNVSLSELAKLTKISKKYLIAMEECKFEDLPFAPIYRKNFIKSYCKALKIDSKKILKKYCEEEENYVDQTTSKINSNTLKNKTSNIRLHNLPLLLRYGAIILFAAIFISYLGIQVKHILEPPTLTVYTPQDGFITNSGNIMIQGKTEREVEILINGTIIANSDNGQFKQILDLPYGVHKIIITARKKHGKSTTETRHVTVRKKQDFSYNL